MVHRVNFGMDRLLGDIGGSICECDDPECVVCKGQCLRVASVRLFLNGEDDTDSNHGRDFCEDCADYHWEEGQYHQGE